MSSSRVNTERKRQRHSAVIAGKPLVVPGGVRVEAPTSVGASLHAKCVVADQCGALFGSANFTDRGQSRNVEVGARIAEAGFAPALVAQFRAATAARVFQAVLDAASGKDVIDQEEGS